jgi:hypothetical protein
VADDKDRFRDEWILDSDCSYHMFPNRDCFSTYESVDGGVLKISKGPILMMKGKKPDSLYLLQGSTLQLLVPLQFRQRLFQSPIPPRAHEAIPYE